MTIVYGFFFRIRLTVEIAFFLPKAVPLLLGGGVIVIAWGGPFSIELVDIVSKVFGYS